MVALEEARLHVSRSTEAAKKSQLGQYLTSESTATFMAGLFTNTGGRCHLLDPGAGIGSLSAAFVDRWRSGGFDFGQIHIDAFEIDESLHGYLSATLGKYPADDFSYTIRGGDFIEAGVGALLGDLLSDPLPRYTHAILNPPYKKINTGSAHRLALRRVGIETVNLYSAFVALTVALAAPGGQIVAIVPRSFCNGPYYRRFREFVLDHAALQDMHLFVSRNRAFKDDDVLQENIIIRLERGSEQGSVRVSSSTDNTFDDYVTHEYSYEQIVYPGDPDRFIHVPLSPDEDAIEGSPKVRYTLRDLGVQVSTGPVVDFRLRNYLHDMPEEHTVPLLYPGHFGSAGMSWPIPGSKKPNAIEWNQYTEKWLMPSGHYCVVRRFSSKEEKRRVVAGFVDPDALGEGPMIGFENHLNVFHEHKHGMPPSLGRGLSVYLNSTVVDENFRRFNGHTQVNAADLRRIRYPSRRDLVELGKWSASQGELTQSAIDERVEALIT